MLHSVAWLEPVVLDTIHTAFFAPVGMGQGEVFDIVVATMLLAEVFESWQRRYRVVAAGDEVEVFEVGIFVGFVHQQQDGLQVVDIAPSNPISVKQMHMTHFAEKNIILTAFFVDMDKDLKVIVEVVNNSPEMWDVFVCGDEDGLSHSDCLMFILGSISRCSPRRNGPPQDWTAV